MSNRVTVQDIADALGISRNTVSKAINNSPGLSPATRDRILKTAAEMGYKQFSYINMVKQELSQAQKSASPRARKGVPSNRAKHIREIALIMEGLRDGSHFATPMLDKFQREIAQMGYAMTIHHLTEEETDNLRLPMTFRPERTSGILCIEVFSEPYARMLCNLGIPTLFVDTPVLHDLEPLTADVLLMENQLGIMSFVRDLIRQGKKEIGFVGHSEHCRSFQERYLAFRNAMEFYGGSIREEFCLTDTYQNKRYPTPDEYLSYLLDRLSKLEHLPDAFICANDFNALDVLITLRRLNYDVPKDVMLYGFDDSPQSKLIQPPLTTVHIHSQIMGLTATHLLISRINEPEMHFRTVHTETTPIYRESAPKSSSIE